MVVEMFGQRIGGQYKGPRSNGHGCNVNKALEWDSTVQGTGGRGSISSGKHTLYLSVLRSQFSEGRLATAGLPYTNAAKPWNQEGQLKTGSLVKAEKYAYAFCFAVRGEIHPHS